MFNTCMKTLSNLLLSVCLTFLPKTPKYLIVGHPSRQPRSYENQDGGLSLTHFSFLSGEQQSDPGLLRNLLTVLEPALALKAGKLMRQKAPI